MLVDTLRIDFIPGKGGDGLVSFAKYGRSLGKNNKIYYPTKGKPDGGNGGRGGDIILEGSSNIYDLSDFTNKQEYKAEDGVIGMPSNKQGKSGRPLIIKVPLVTVIADTNGKQILRIEKDGEKKLLAKGGEGGIGNFAFRQGQVSTLMKHTKGGIPKRLKVFIQLQLAADIVFIGLPNAGKSSMLNALTNAHVKTASYPFTTIVPQIGVMDPHIKLMDLPGLIEGVAEGKGLGKGFSKHTFYSKLVAHFISLESEDVEKDYLTIRKELEAFSTGLCNKPELIVLTKSDLFDKETIEKKADKLKAYNTNIIVVSSQYNENVEKLEKLFKEFVFSI